MTIVQFINAMEKYSADVIALAFAVCLATSLVKKLVPANCKKYLTFVPFLLGCLAYGVYMFFTDRDYSVFSAQTVEKGLQSGAVATIYYVLYEQFVRGKKNLAGISDVKQLAVAGILKDTVIESQLYAVSGYISQNVSANLADAPYCVTLCVNALSGKTRPGVSDTDVIASARLIVSALSALV